MAAIQHMKAGRTWSATAESGINSVVREYVIDRSAAGMGGVAWDSGDEGKFYASQGIPEVGDAHPDYDWLYVSNISVREGSGGDKNLVTITVNYSAVQSEDQSGSSEKTDSCEQWGWRSGSVSRDLVTDVDTNLPVLNSAGDPFDQTVQVDRPSPVFTKVLKTTARKSGWIEYCNKVNKKETEIGGKKCGAHTLKCVQVDEERIFGDQNWKYRYTVGLQWMSNLVKVKGAEQATEIGWDVAVVDMGLNTGMPGSGTRKRVTETDGSGNDVPASLPVLLDGTGERATGDPPTPYNLVFRAYAECEFPELFYSEPA